MHSCIMHNRWNKDLKSFRSDKVLNSLASKILWFSHSYQIYAFQTKLAKPGLFYPSIQHSFLAPIRIISPTIIISCSGNSNIAY